MTEGRESEERDERRRDDWDRHWSDYDAALGRNPATKWRHRLLLSSLKLEPGDRLLDIGAGQGDFARAVRDRHPDVDILGLELSRTGCRMAAAKVPDARFRAVDLLSGAEPEADERGRATHAVCTEVLEHVDNPAALLRAASAWMAPGCRLIVTVPGGPMSAFDRHIGHRRHVTPEAARRMVEAAGLSVSRAEGAGFPFFNLYRIVVIARGRRLIGDVRDGPRELSALARTAMDVFDLLFRLNPSRGRLGWQIVVVAGKPPATDAGGRDGTDAQEPAT